MMVAETTETCWWIVIYDKIYFISAHCFFCYINVKFSLTHLFGTCKFLLFCCLFVWASNLLVWISLPLSICVSSSPQVVTWFPSSSFPPATCGLFQQSDLGGRRDSRANWHRSYCIYHMIWYDIYGIWYMIWYDIWYDTWYDMVWYIWYDICHMTWYYILYMTWHDMIWYKIYDMTWVTWHDILYVTYYIWHDMIWYMMLYDMIW
jgi:hypothetical protein